MRKLFELLALWTNHIKLKYFHREIIIKNQFLGERVFACKNNVEFYRANNFGGEESALGAFLFLINEDDVIWDIGASIGLFSIYSAPHVKKVVSFEPEEEIFSRFSKNIQLNGLNDKIIPWQLGISSNLGEISLNTDGLNGNSPSISNLGRHKSSKYINVNSIDNLISDGFELPSVLKIDIEGAEILALIGAKKLLASKNAPRLLFIEIHPAFLPNFNSSSDEILNILSSNGYIIITSKIREKESHIIAVKN